MSLILSTPGNVIVDECIRLRKNIQPISEKYHGLLEKSNLNNTKYPFVLLLGNHSSGKSSFVNFLLDRKVQTTGVAPTDDCFTIIGSGTEDIDKNGPALVGDPDLGFSSLKMFGPNLVNHTQLKIRSNVAIKDFMIVDSPGMIDSPGMVHSHKQPIGGDKMDRGYHFEGVCRWYAERADVILLFFDPDKPGTTGETLSILTNSLVGLDHKLHILLNKADQFHRIHDFARAYGSLCWNLSKVIARKDLPRIHTMCLPAHVIAEAHQSDSPSHNDNTTQNFQEDAMSELTVDHTVLRLPESRGKPPRHPGQQLDSHQQHRTTFFDQGRFDLEEAREEVIKEVFNAPRRRVDNEISRLSDSIHALLMHCNLVDHVTAAYRNKLWKGRALVGLTAAASVGITVAAGYLFSYLSGSPDPEDISEIITKPSDVSENLASVVKSGVVTSGRSIFDLFRFETKQSLYAFGTLSGACVTSAVNLYREYTLDKYAVQLISRASYEESFKQLYSSEISKKDLYTIALGDLVLDHLVHNFSVAKLVCAPAVKKEDKLNLTRILNEDVANLRRRAAPNYPLLSPAPTPQKTAGRLDIWSTGNNKSLFRSTEALQAMGGTQSDTPPVMPHIFSANYEEKPSSLLTQHTGVASSGSLGNLLQQAELLSKETISVFGDATLHDENDVGGLDLDFEEPSTRYLSGASHEQSASPVELNQAVIESCDNTVDVLNKVLDHHH